MSRAYVASGKDLLDTNRRSETRLRTPRIPVRVASHESFEEQYVHDLSRGGMFIVTDQLLPVGSEIEVDLYPPAWAEPLELRGFVVRVADDEAAHALGRVGMGIRLEGVPEWTKSRLDALLAQVKMQGVPKPSADAPPAPPKPKPSPPAPVPASAVWTPDELREAKLAELEGQLQLARERIDGNAAQLESLERELADSRAQTDSLQRQKDALELELRHETDRLNAELEQLRNRGGNKLFVLSLFLLPVSAALAFVAFSDSSWAMEMRGKLRGQRRALMGPVMAGRPDAGVVRVAESALVVRVDAGSPAAPVVAAAATEAPDAGAAAPVAVAANEGPSESKLTIQIDKHTVVFVDGKRIGRAPVKAVALSPGMHRVRFTCSIDGRTVMTKPRYVRVPQGEDITVEYFCEDLVPAN